MKPSYSNNRSALVTCMAVLWSLAMSSWAQVQPMALMCDTQTEPTVLHTAQLPEVVEARLVSVSRDVLREASVGQQFVLNVSPVDQNTITVERMRYCSPRSFTLVGRIDGSPLSIFIIAVEGEAVAGVVSRSTDRP